MNNGLILNLNTDGLVASRQCLGLTIAYDYITGSLD